MRRKNLGAARRLRNWCSYVALLAVVVVGDSGRAALAHNGKNHVEGTVSAIEKKKIVLRQPNGRPVSIRLTESTSYRMRESGLQTTAANLSVGCRVFVESFGMPGAEQAALEILISDPAEEPSEPAGQ